MIAALRLLRYSRPSTLKQARASIKARVFRVLRFRSRKGGGRVRRGGRGEAGRALDEKGTVKGGRAGQMSAENGGGTNGRPKAEQGRAERGGCAAR